MDRVGLRSTGRRRITLDLAADPPRPLDDVPRLLAGAAEVDITPPPGLPKAGYSRNANDGNGFRTRLRARVVHLRCGTTSLAVVATDLLGGSALLQHLVAARIADTTDVPLAGLFIGATHTHGAPGQFHGTDFYNRFSSNRAGFDPDWTGFLVERIVLAVEQAVRGRQPAVAGWGRVQVHGLTRNRSLPAYRRNPGQPRATAEDAVNPWLDLLRVDSDPGGAERAAAERGGADSGGADSGGADSGGGGLSEPIAALVTFSIHGTAVPMTTRPYNADLWSYLCTHLGDVIFEAGGRRPLVGALQGTHGDVTPALQGPAGHAEAARIGRGVAEVAAGVYARLEDSLRPRLDLGCALQAVDLRNQAERTVSGVSQGGHGVEGGQGGPGGEALPERPAVGAALVAGARENLTPVVSRLPIFRAGDGKRWSHSVHGAKWVLGSRWGQRFVLPLDAFPRVLPVHLVRVGEVLLVGLPMEITTRSGELFAAAAEDAWGNAASEQQPSEQQPSEQQASGQVVRAVVSSVVNEYAGYCTTEQEYSAQFYEGGHTLYGPLTQRFLAGRVSRSAAALRGSDAVAQDVMPRTVTLRVRRFPPPAGSRATEVTSLGEVSTPGPGVFEWRWRGPGFSWHEPVVAVEVDDGTGWTPLAQPGGRVLDDGHGDLEVFVEAGTGRAGHAGAVFGVRWHAAELRSVPAEQMPGTEEAPRYRFRLRDASSPSF